MKSFKNILTEAKDKTTTKTLQKCPYCSTSDYVPDYIWKHTVKVGTGQFNFPCKKCDELIKVNMERLVYGSNPSKSTKNDFTKYIK